MKLGRQQILGGNYLYPSGLITLKITDHFEKRLEERGVGLGCMPTKVRVTKDNIYSAKITKDGRRFESCVVRLKYSKTRYLFVCFNPNNGTAISMWFQGGSYENYFKQLGRQAIRDDRSEVSDEGYPRGRDDNNNSEGEGQTSEVV